MKKILGMALLILIVGLIGVGESLAGESYFFRQANIGDSRADVRAREGEPFLEGPEGLVYTAKINGYNFYGMYGFTPSDEFYLGAYMLADSWRNTDRYLLAFNSIKEMLTEIYGEPVGDRKAWQTVDGLPKRGYSDSDAISAELMVLEVIWSVDDDLRIGMTLWSKQGDIDLNIGYYDKDVATGYADRQREESKSQL